jgi:hypothetical protein
LRVIICFSDPLQLPKITTSSPAAVAVQRAADWLIHSGIQEAGGGVARYYLSDSRRNARVSHEITGYAVSALTYLYQATGDRACLDAAQRAAASLIAAWDESSATMPFEPVSDGEPAFAYFFDCGIIVRGLLAAYRATGHEEYLDKAKQCALSMAFDFMADEAMHPIIRLPEKEPVEYAGRWSRRPGCYQLKAAMAWREVAEQTNRPELMTAYERMLAYSLATHDRFLPGETDQEGVMDRLHAYAYFLEGLLPAADRSDCAAALRSGIDRISEWLHRVAPVFVRSDVYGQLLRLRLFAAGAGVIALDEIAAEEEANAIFDFQADDRDARIGGGFWFGAKRRAFLPFVNPVSTAFCAQALLMYDDFRAGRFHDSAAALV